jgi:hypothetical protein
MEKAKFTRLSANEVKVEYKGTKFMLVERSRGVYGSGRAVQLYLMKDFEKTHIKEIGWTKCDGHGSDGMLVACIPSLTTFEACKEAAIKYIDLMI